MNLMFSHEHSSAEKGSAVSCDSPSGQAPEESNDPVRRENERQLKYVPNALLGIVLAGTIYPIPLVFLSIVFETGLPSRADLPEALAVMFSFALYGVGIGFIISGLTGLASILLIICLNRSLGNPLDPRSAAIFAGSLAGYMPIAWVMLMPEFGKDIREAIYSILCGPALAMTLGAIGAAWASAKHGQLEPLEARTRKKHSLSIRHLLFGTAWIACVFSISNMFGGFGFAITTAVWIVCQALMFAVIAIWRRIRCFKVAPLSELSEP